MSEHNPHHPNHDHHDHHGDHHDDGGGYHATVKGYVVGFILSVVLTAVPFWLVMNKVLPSNLTAFVILGFAAVQIVVHMVYFLHMNAKVEGGWSMLALIFTGALVIIMLSGSIWVMYHLNTNMMPMPAHDVRNMP
jgi:cytochrome o ubiquinol oxidase operon protein cyoD